MFKRLGVARAVSQDALPSEKMVLTAEGPSWLKCVSRPSANNNSLSRFAEVLLCTACFILHVLYAGVLKEPEAKGEHTVIQHVQSMILAPRQAVVTHQGLNFWTYFTQVSHF